MRCEGEGGVVGECLCGSPAVHAHHVVYEQHVRRRGGDVADERNLIGLCYDCHRRHHNRVAVLPLSVLPGEAVDFAHELMGDAATDYFRRYYA